jgi:hypothetical protein
MRTSSLALFAACALLAAAGGGRALAFDEGQFCQAVHQFLRAATVDTGNWIDRTTRNDGVEIRCDRKMVHFKRYSSTPVSGLSDAWKERKTQEWESAYCSKPMWREASQNGWVVSATVTTVKGESVWLACLPNGRGFHRAIP